MIKIIYQRKYIHICCLYNIYALQQSYSSTSYFFFNVNQLNYTLNRPKYLNMNYILFLSSIDNDLKFNFEETMKGIRLGGLYYWSLHNINEDSRLLITNLLMI